MCGRYYIEVDYNAAQLMEIIIRAREKAQKAGEELKTGEIFPSSTAPVIARNRKSEKSVFAMKWGFSSAEKSALIINARRETAEQKPLFRDSMRDRRCVIPSSGYYEWRNKEKFAITTPNHIAFMAGIYRFEGERAVFCVLTTEPTKSIAQIHNRMPLILSQDMTDDWINGNLKVEDAAMAEKPEFEIARI